MALRLRRLDVRHPLTIATDRTGPPYAERYETAISGPVATGSTTTPDPIPPALHPRCSRTDPTQGIDKETAAASFNDWWNALPPNTVTIFSDGSESYDDAGKHVGYGYAIYQGQALVATGKGAINTLSHVFDAEAIGALKGLQKALTLPSNADTQRWLCIDSTSVIWCKRANASDTSQWAFLECCTEEWFRTRLRSQERYSGSRPTAQPTISGIGSIARSLAHNVTSGWWRKNEPTLSGRYRKWQLDYALKEPMELKLSRPTLHRLLALRSRHGDFEAYHKRFKHEDAETHCPCGKAKTPEHLVFLTLPQTAEGDCPTELEFERPPGGGGLSAST
ncbi:hypothetical protein DID88_001115 [Monilinia fructigena]|uniref:RNase H type-1 domain-containing protein n=1 Tax=Monilinia fructigena TaxID=38457 RepID=A0A395IXJ7_9HELO|nr:hypothetical protein DID88_001115 [Monilinia fructigena]